MQFSGMEVISGDVKRDEPKSDGTFTPGCGSSVKVERAKQGAPTFT
jgi:hypothetical protein